MPFPIPKDGYEAMWNHLTRYVGFAYQFRGKSFTVDASGRPALSTETVNTNEFPYYDPKKTSTDIFYMVRLDYKGPARRAGEALLVHDPLNYLNGNRRAWQYLPGQRRVKLAPDIAYDTPNPVTSGMTTYDDAFMYNGKMDRYDFKLLGKKEIVVPYNDYRFVYNTKMDDVFKPQFVNPDVGTLGASPRLGRRGDAQARRPPHLREAPLLPRRGHVDRRRVRRVRRARQLFSCGVQLSDAVVRRSGRLRRLQRVLRPDRRHVHGARPRVGDRRRSLHRPAAREGMDGRRARRLGCSLKPFGRSRTLAPREDRMATRTFAPLLATLALLAAPSAWSAPYVDVLDTPAQKSSLASQRILNGVALAGNRVVVVGQRGHILYSDDRGSTWTQAIVPVSVDLVAVHFPSAQKGWAVGHSGVVLATADARRDVGQATRRALGGTGDGRPLRKERSRPCAG